MLKAEHERQCNKGAAIEVKRELQAKFTLIVDGAKLPEIMYLTNEKTGEKFYTRYK